MQEAVGADVEEGEADSHEKKHGGKLVSKGMDLDKQMGLNR